MKSTLDIRIDESLKEKLREIAKKRHRSMTQQIEHWIEQEYIFVCGTIKYTEGTPKKE